MGEREEKRKESNSIRDDRDDNGLDDMISTYLQETCTNSPYGFGLWGIKLYTCLRNLDLLADSRLDCFLFCLFISRSSCTPYIKTDKNIATLLKKPIKL